MSFEEAREVFSAETSSEVEEQQSVSSPRQRACLHVTRCLTIQDLQKKTYILHALLLN